MAFELVLERKGRMRRKGVHAKETEGTDAESHEEVMQAWLLAPHTGARGPGGSEPGETGGDQITKGVCLTQELR